MYFLQRSLHLFNFNSYVPPIDSSLSQPKRKSYSYQFQRLKILQSSIQGSYETIDKAQKHSTRPKVNACIEVAENSLPHVQTLSKLPKEELRGKVVMVRLDSNVLLLEVLDTITPSVDRSLTTIKYLHHTGAKVLIASNWGGVGNEVQILSREILADHLSSVLQLKVVPVNWLSGCTQSKKEVLKEKDILLIENLSEFREEISNCSAFSRKLSSGVDIFVNDAFSQTHKILASTVGVPRYCCSSVSGFCFEKELSQVLEITNITEQPYIAVIGGGNIYDKAAALHVLASKCDGLVFVGMMAFQIMHALGLPVPLSFVERSAVEDSFKIVNHARKRNIPILLPKDFWCLNDSVRAEVNIFPADGILNGWSPVDLGPASLDEISFLLSKCKKILWIGPVKFKLSRREGCGTIKLARLLETLSRSGCDVTVVGRAACKAITGTSCRLIENASAMWEVLKGRSLPGVMALDRAYLFEVNWNDIYYNAAQPLVIDIGSGNGLFLLGMARGQKALNFLGLEINKKLVRRCLDSICRSGQKKRVLHCNQRNINVPIYSFQLSWRTGSCFNTVSKP